MIIKTFKQAEEYLNHFISTGHKFIFEGSSGLDRVKKFYKLLGNPQEKIKIIHVAGTSGKSSTCYLISSLLASQGFKVGLTLSPHLVDVRERFQIDNKIISKEEFVFYLNKIIPFIKGPLSYFEILVGLAFYIFAEKKVDYAVIETGLGGLYDATNTVSRPDKLAVITKIGIDHTNVLGKTIEKITYQKAMIINKNSQAISISQDLRAERVIREVAKNQKARLFFVPPMSFPRRRESRLQSPFKDVINRLDPLLQGDDNSKTLINNLGLIGEYQQENATLALAVVNYLGQRDGFEINKDKVGAVFQTAYFPGRFDIKKIKNKTVIFDGAHNPQKMKAFISSLIKKYPDTKFNFLLAFKKGKDYKEMLKIIVHPPSPRLRRASKIIITSFLTENQDMINSSEDPAEIGNRLNQIDVGVVIVIPNLKTAWEAILEEDEPIVVTGSLYLVGEIFKLINTTNTTNKQILPINKKTNKQMTK